MLLVDGPVSVVSPSWQDQDFPSAASDSVCLTPCLLQLKKFCLPKWNDYHVQWLLFLHQAHWIAFILVNFSIIMYSKIEGQVEFGSIPRHIQKEGLQRFQSHQKRDKLLHGLKPRDPKLCLCLFRRNCFWNHRWKSWSNFLMKLKSFEMGTTFLSKCPSQ